MNYIKTGGGVANVYPYSLNKLRSDFPNTSFPADLTQLNTQAFGVYPVTSSTPPAYNKLTHKLVVSAQSLVGIWTEVWTAVALTEGEQVSLVQGIQEEIVSQTQKRLDDFAATRNYDGILSVCTYATSSVPKFLAEGQYCVDIRDATWATLYTLLATVQAGTRAMPLGYSEIEPELPALTWPV
jgi:hypothetical protein